MQHTHCRRDTYIYDGDRGVCETRTKEKIGLFLRSAGVIGMQLHPVPRSTIPLNSCCVLRGSPAVAGTASIDRQMPRPDPWAASAANLPLLSRPPPLPGSIRPFTTRR